MNSKTEEFTHFIFGTREINLDIVWIKFSTLLVEKQMHHYTSIYSLSLFIEKFMQTKSVF